MKKVLKWLLSCCSACLNVGINHTEKNFCGSLRIAVKCLNAIVNDYLVELWTCFPISLKAWIIV